MVGKIGLALWCIGCLFLAACSTVDSRIHEKPADYSSLSPRDQALVKSEMIREGLPKGAVYIARGCTRPNSFRFQKRSCLRSLGLHEA